jgi:uncharacterized membrane protein YedE/YeeE
MMIPWSGLILGLLFGLILEGAGFGDPGCLTAQLRFTNWAVFKVMFTAIVVSGILLYASRAMGLIHLSDIFVPSVYFWGTLLGGAGVGIGMAVGGYCPGTSAVAMASGRLDGLVFLVGIGGGTVVFNGVFPFIKSWIYAQTGPTSLTLPQLLHVSPWVVLTGLTAILIAVSWMIDRRGKNPTCAAMPTLASAQVNSIQPEH